MVAGIWTLSRTAVDINTYYPDFRPAAFQHVQLSLNIISFSRTAVWCLLTAKARLMPTNWISTTAVNEFINKSKTTEAYQIPVTLLPLSKLYSWILCMFHPTGRLFLQWARSDTSVSSHMPANRVPWHYNPDVTRNGITIQHSSWRRVPMMMLVP